MSQSRTVRSSGRSETMPKNNRKLKNKQTNKTKQTNTRKRENEQQNKTNKQNKQTQEKEKTNNKTKQNKTNKTNKKVRFRRLRTHHRHSKRKTKSVKKRKKKSFSFSQIRLIFCVQNRFSCRCLFCFVLFPRLSRQRITVSTNQIRRKELCAAVRLRFSRRCWWLRSPSCSPCLCQRKRRKWSVW